MEEPFTLSDDTIGEHLRTKNSLSLKVSTRLAPKHFTKKRNALRLLIPKVLRHSWEAKKGQAAFWETLKELFLEHVDAWLARKKAGLNQDDSAISFSGQLSAGLAFIFASMKSLWSEKADSWASGKCSSYLLILRQHRWRARPHRGWRASGHGSYARRLAVKW